MKPNIFLTPLADYLTVTIPLEINQWEEVWQAAWEKKQQVELQKRIALLSLSKSESKEEEKDEEKKALPLVGTSLSTEAPPLSVVPTQQIVELLPLPFTYNSWVEDWFKNPEKNLSHTKYSTSNKNQVIAAHTFAQVIDYFVKLVGLKGRYQNKNNPNKWYESWTIGVEIEDRKGKKQREYITYGFHEKTGILEHRSCSIAAQEKEIEDALEKAFGQFDWPALCAAKNNQLLKEMSAQLCQKYKGADKSCLSKVEEYTLTFWDERNQSSLQIMNPYGIEALKALL
ncbi:MAG: hypothetical protein JWO53_764 [Chlamydiia bacterium]|nr:hypothetical protein [Chlamydiia bacterium]